jgi:cardiolipin synthase
VIALAPSFGVVILLLVVWSIRRHRDPHLHIDCSSPIEELMPSLAGLTLATAVDGNTVEIFENGAYFEVLLAEIRSAKRSVHFETFLWAEGVLGQRVADALSERSRAGLQVRVLLDATGTTTRLRSDSKTPRRRSGSRRFSRSTLPAVPRSSWRSGASACCGIAWSTTCTT